jgi:copper chaperone CopZ
MRMMVAIMTVLTMFGLGAAAAPQTDRPAAGDTSTLKVKGMACSACAARVQKEALKVDGVTSAKVDQPKGTAEITFDPTKTTPEAVAAAISKHTPFKAEAPKTDQKKR